MKTFYLTFGQQSPLKNGFILVYATDEIKARELVFEKFKNQWSGLYPEEIFEEEYFPQGILGRITEGKN